MKRTSFRFPLIVAAIIIAYPLLARGEYLLSIGVLAGIYAICAVANNLLLGETGQISLGHAGFLGMGAYATGILATAGMSPLLAMLLATVLTGAFGFLVGLTSIRLQHSHLAMATIAAQIIFLELVLEWEPVTGGVYGFSGIPKFDIFGVSITGAFFFYLVWAVVGLVILCNRNILHSRTGIGLAAVRDDETAAASLGINTAWCKLQVFTLSALYIGFAGGLLAFDLGYVGHQSFSVHVSMVILSMVVLGGVRPYWAGIVGAVIVTILPEGLRWIAQLDSSSAMARAIATDYTYVLIVNGILVIVFVMFLPNGVVGILRTLGKRGKVAKEGARRESVIGS
jgi:branched-chain amino acid transport system permease protein